jgi:hypothetical protein
MMMAKENGEKVVPPYLPWETFKEFIGHLKATAIPLELDRSVRPSGMPSLVRGQVQTSLRFLQLLEGKTPTNNLKELVVAHGTDRWKDAVIEHVVGPYDQVLDGLDIANATRDQLDERFKRIGVDGQMLLKSTRFLLAMLRDAGVDYSPHLSVPREGTGGRRSPKSPESKRTNRGAQYDGAPKVDARPPKNPPADGTITIPLYLPDKPLGELIVPKDLDDADCDMIDAMLRAYAKRRSHAK